MDGAQTVLLLDYIIQLVTVNGCCCGNWCQSLNGSTGVSSVSWESVGTCWWSLWELVQESLLVLWYVTTMLYINNCVADLLAHNPINHLATKHRSTLPLYL